MYREWVDTDVSPLPTEWGRTLQALGVQGVVLDCWNARPSDLTLLQAARLPVELYVGYDPALWLDGVAGAQARAHAAVTRADTLGYARGQVLWLDVEQWPQTGPAATARACVAWVTAWATATRAAGYVPGVYLGEPLPPGLTATDWPPAGQSPIAHWWLGSPAAAGAVRVHPPRLTQIAWNVRVGNVLVNRDLRWVPDVTAPPWPDPPAADRAAWAAWLRAVADRVARG